MFVDETRPDSKDFVVGPNFEGFQQAVRDLSDDETTSLGLEVETPRLKQTIPQSGYGVDHMETYDGRNVEINKGSGVHTTIRDVGFSSSLYNPLSANLGHKRTVKRKT